MKNITLFFLINLFLLNVILINCQLPTQLFKQVNKDYKGKNLSISPLNIYRSLALAANAVEGQAQEEILKFLRNRNLDEANSVNSAINNAVKRFTTISMPSGLMTKFTPLFNFSSKCRSLGLNCEELMDVQQVNQWVKSYTNGGITQIMSYISSTTLIVLLDAVYFRAEWEQIFNKALTKKKTFYNYSQISRKVEVNFMNQTRTLGYYEDFFVKAVQLNYKRDFFALVIIPTQFNDIDKYIDSSNFDEEQIQLIVKGMESKKVNLLLPKFQINSIVNLNQVCKNMGINTIFSYDADFTPIITEDKPRLETVIDETLLKVDEIGADYTTDVPIEADSYPAPILMDVEYPFLFVLMSKKLPSDHNIVLMAKIETLG